MAELIRVDDPADPRLADYVSLRDVQLRRHLEAEHGFFIAEGEKVVRRAASAGYPVRSFLMAERWLDGLRDILDSAADAPCYVVTEALAEQVTGFHVHRGALAALARTAVPPVEEVLARARRIVLLEDIVDHTNVGAIFRCAAAFGMDAVLLSPRCADPLYRRAVKVAMGAVFSVPWTRLDDWYDAMPMLAGRGFQTIALSLSPDSTPLTEVQVAQRTALVMGAEGHGLTHRWQQGASIRATIPMANGIDSLNVAAAAAVACHWLRFADSWDRAAAGPPSAR
ncbi:MAG TPA: RNA methyltransferase [Nocardioidaceae bacterium]|jgi:tRNA G18 (ribose-2'-O)-methylase SpoU